VARCATPRNAAATAFVQCNRPSSIRWATIMSPAAKQSTLAPSPHPRVGVSHCLHDASLPDSRRVPTSPTMHGADSPALKAFAPRGAPIGTAPRDTGRSVTT
jgi:hypothetical protein